MKHILIIIFLLLFGQTYAQIKIHKNINRDDGLVYSQVLCMLEDSKGFLWMGTQAGLSCWDGINFKNYTKKDGLKSNSIHFMAESNDGTIFIGTRSGLNIFKDNQLTIDPNIPEKLNDRINAILAFDDSTIYLGGDQSGLWLFDGQHYKNFTVEDGLPANRIKSLAKGLENSLYVGTLEKGLAVYKNQKFQQIDLPPGDGYKQVNTIFAHPDGALMIGTVAGLIIYNENKMTIIDDEKGLPDNFVTDICAGIDDEIYIGTAQGIVQVKENQITGLISKENGLSSSFIWEIMRSNAGDFYLGTDGTGVDIFTPNKVENFTTKSGLPDNNVWSIYEAKDGTLYFGTDKGLVVYKESRFEIYTTADGLSSDMIITIYEAQNGDIYLGTDLYGVNIFKNGRFSALSSKNGLTSDLVWSISEDDEGHIYFGTYENGICVYDGYRMIDTLTTKNGLLGNSITTTYKSDEGVLYFGTEKNGAFLLSNDKNFLISPIINNGTVWSILKDNKEDKLYFGMDETGLIVFEKGLLDTLTINDGLSNNTVIGIMQDEDGKLYLTTDNGFNILDFSDDTLKVRIISKEDGLASNECNQGAYLKDSKGNLWIGTIAGVSKYRPEFDKPVLSSPHIHFTKMKLFNQDLPFLKKETLQNFTYNENYFNFEYIGIDLASPSKVVYQHRLSGIDKDWVQTNRRFVQYTNLNNGSYTFEVKARNHWGVWSEPNRLSFKISPPFWKSWWFALLIAAIVLFPIVVVVYTRIQRLLAMERLRAKIAADLHDDIGAGLSEISILSAVIEAKSPIDFKDSVKNELNKIGSVSRSLIESMSDIVWLVNPKNDSLHDLFTRLKDSFVDLLEQQGVQFKTTNLKKLETIHLSMENRQHIFLIFKEAINNALKYSECSTLELMIETKRRYLLIYLLDNGKGFNPKTITTGNGLLNMQRRAEKVGGKVTLNSEPDKGTEVVFRGKV